MLISNNIKKKKHDKMSGIGWGNDKKGEGIEIVWYFNQIVLFLQ